MHTIRCTTSNFAPIDPVIEADRPLMAENKVEDDLFSFSDDDAPAMPIVAQEQNMLPTAEADTGFGFMEMEDKPASSGFDGLNEAAGIARRKSY